MSKHQNNDDFCISINLDLPEKYIHQDEINLVAAHLGELLQHVIREADTGE